MKPEYEIKKEILATILADNPGIFTMPDPEALLDFYYSPISEEIYLSDWIDESQQEMRGGDVETGLKCEYSRHYESRSVAKKMESGNWVGWTYWYGGGKHGEPEAIDWIEDAYYLNVEEEEKTVIVRTFKQLDSKEDKG